MSTDRLLIYYFRRAFLASRAKGNNKPVTSFVDFVVPATYSGITRYESF